MVQKWVQKCVPEERFLVYPGCALPCLYPPYPALPGYTRYTTPLYGTMTRVSGVLRCPAKTAWAQEAQAAWVSLSLREAWPELSLFFERSQEDRNDPE